MDYDLGDAAHIPLATTSPAGDTYAAADITVSVRQPDATTVGPYTPTETDLSNGWYPFTATQAGLHRYRVAETTGQATVNEGSFYVWPTYKAHSAAWVPDLADVAGLVPTRTIDASGQQRNTFTDSTTPTDDQVLGYVDRIVGEITATVGEVPSEAFDAAKHTAALGVAWLVERSFPPTSDVVNVANDFVNDYRASLSALRLAARRVQRTSGVLWTQKLGADRRDTIFVTTDPPGDLFPYLAADDWV